MGMSSYTGLHESPSISLEDVLNIKYLGKWNWSPDGRFIAYIWDDGGLHELWLVEPGVSEPVKISNAGKGVTDFAWEPEGTGLWFIQDGSLRYVDVNRASLPETLYDSTSSIWGLSWAPDGSNLAFAREGKISLFNKRTRSIKELSLPGRIVPEGRSGCVEWDPTSEKFAFSFRDEETYLQLGVATAGGKVIWRSFFKNPPHIITWLDRDNLLFYQPNEDGTCAAVMLLNFNSLSLRRENVSSAGESNLRMQEDPAKGSGDTSHYKSGRPATHQVYYIQGTGKGTIMEGQATLSPDRSKLLFLLENDGWAHYYLAEVSDVLRCCGTDDQSPSGTHGSLNVRQLTFGEHEDFGHAGDAAAWWPDSRSFVYASNRDSRGERHLFRYYLDSGVNEKIVGLPGQNTMPKISSQGRLAFVHCDAFKNMDIWIVGEEGPRQVTFSMPPSWTEENQYVPEEISFKSAGGLTIYGYLMKPKNIRPGEKLPGLVWVHGGPVRQMRPGWHPLRSYALFHGFNQYLVSRGYVVLEVNYRGGIGYGRAFREALFHKMGVDDVEDVCNAGLYLKSLPYVDPERVGVWGLSYGGYMTLHCLTQRPEVFKMGVNIAGIWDFVQWTRWAEKRYGKGPGLFKVYLGGDPETSPDLYRQASPRTFVRGMKAPLLNVQGTSDLNVDFEQMNSIIRDCVENGKYHEVIYYPGEVHTFAKKKTWLDAMPKIEAFMDRFLKN